MRNRDWKIGRRGRAWTSSEFHQRYNLTPEKLEVVRGRLLSPDGQRVKLLGLLLENLGADRAVRLGDPGVWRAAVAALDAPDMDEPNRYEMIVTWSDADRAFVVKVPELSGCMADGPTRETAIAAAEQVIREWIESAHALGRPMPAAKR